MVSLLWPVDMAYTIRFRIGEASSCTSTSVIGTVHLKDSRADFLELLSLGLVKDKSLALFTLSRQSFVENRLEKFNYMTPELRVTTIL